MAASSLYEKASIFFVPSGYKSGKLYPQKPTDGSSDFDVTRATTAFRTNASGILESVASGVPRLDYPAAGGCPSLLVEPAATNLVLRSEEFDNASWAKTEINVSGNVSISPDGTTTSDLLIPSITNTAHFLLQDRVLASGTVYTQSIYIKANGYSFVQITGSTGFPLTFANFNLNNGTLGTTDGGTATITNAGNGWYRLSYTITANASGSGRMLITIVPSATSARNAAFSGDGISGVLAWGAQLEVGSVATSYIPTTAATATRNADVISKTGVSGFIGQTEGTVYAEVDLRAAATARRVFLLSDGTAANEIRVTASSLNLGDLQFAVRIAGTLQVNSFSPTNVYLSGTFKIAAAYKNADYALYVNGVQVLVSTASGSLPSCSRIDLGSQLGTSNFLNDRIRAAAIYPTRLTNSELSSLTSL
jgi:hypothetical protein